MPLRRDSLYSVDFRLLQFGDAGRRAGAFADVRPCADPPVSARMRARRGLASSARAHCVSVFLGRCDVNAGEVLFTPAYWWHEVRSEADPARGHSSIGINWFYERHAAAIRSCHATPAQVGLPPASCLVTAQLLIAASISASFRIRAGSARRTMRSCPSRRSTQTRRFRRTRTPLAPRLAQPAKGSVSTTGSSSDSSATDNQVPQVVSKNSDEMNELLGHVR